MVTLSPGRARKGGGVGPDRGPGQKCPCRLPAASLRGTTIFFFFYVLPENISCIYIHTFMYMYSVYIKVCIFIFLYLYEVYTKVLHHIIGNFHITLEQL